MSRCGVEATEAPGSARANQILYPLARTEAYVVVDAYLALHQPLGRRSQLADLVAVG